MFRKICPTAVVAAAYLGCGGADCSPARADFVVLKPENFPSDVRALIEQQTRDAGPPASLDQAPSAAREIAARMQIIKLRRDIAEKMLGKGWDIWQGKVFETCVSAKQDGVVEIVTPPNTPNSSNVYRVRQIEGLSEHHSTRSSGGSLSLTYDLLSFGGGLNDYSSKTYQWTSRYVDVFIRSIAHEFWMTRGTPTSSAIDNLDPSDLGRFAKRCGQQFVSRVGFGTQLDGRLSFQVVVNAKTSANDANLDIGIGEILSFTAKNEEKLSELSKISAISVETKGTAGAQPKPEEFLEYSRTFGTSSNFNDATNVVLIETTSYAQIDHRRFRDFDDIALTAGGTVQRLASDKAAVLQQIGDLELAEGKPDFMEVVALADELKVRREYIDALGKLYVACRDALDAAKVAACVAASKALPARPPKPLVKLKGQEG